MSGFDKPTQEQLKAQLTPMQYKVTQRDGTEPPFNNEFWDNKEPGIYVDVVSGEPLFCSQDKFDSGTGWPSFTRPLKPKNVVERQDRKLFMVRTEVRSADGDSHLGHVFPDGPAPTGLRYCINSAALRFIPARELHEQGYGEFADLFSAQDNAAPAKSSDARETEEAVLAGGCFWGMEELIRAIPGVLDTEVGYTGGHTDAPVYGDVKTGKTGHAEAVRVRFDPRRLSYDVLLSYFFRMHDPTTANRQGNDIGSQYRSAIFVTTEQQRATAQAAIARVNGAGRWAGKVVTQIAEAGVFYPAEHYHQDYLQRYPDGYTCHYLRDE